MTIHCSQTVRNVLAVAALVMAGLCSAFLVRQARVLSETDMRVNSLIEHVPNGVIVCTAAGKVVMVNRAAEHLTGFTADEIIKNGVGIIIPEGFKVRHDKAFTTATERITHADEPANHGAYRQILPVLRKDGTMFRATITIGTIPREGHAEFFAFITPVYKKKAKDLTTDMPEAVFEER